MKFLKSRRMLSMIVSVCMLLEIIDWSSVGVWAAEPSDVTADAEDQKELLEGADSQVPDEDSDASEESTDGENPEKEDQTGDQETEEPPITDSKTDIPDSTTEDSKTDIPEQPEEESEDQVSDPSEETDTPDSDVTEEGTGDLEGPEEKDDQTDVTTPTEDPAETEDPDELEPEEISEEPVEENTEATISELSKISKETYATPGNFANIVLFVDFQDTDHSGHTSYLGKCFMDDAEYTLELFNGNEQSTRGMRQFVSNISYGQLELANIFPQYDEETGAITPYLLKNNENYYYNNDSAMIQEAVQQMRENGHLSEDLDVDRNGDMMVDNLTIVVPCQKNGGSDYLYGHKADFPGNESVNGKRVGAYNVIPESGAYLGGNFGVIAHEFLHTIGYPDLYRRNATQTTGKPVERWDIMASTSWFVQYPLAYLRGKITGWFDIPEVKESVQGMSLYAASTASYENRDQQAVILKTEYSDTEFFVLEYRKQGRYASDVDYDCKIPGSGLIIYRVNLACETNITGDGDMIYVFRPGDGYDDNHLEIAGGNLDASFLSAESGRTSYGTHDMDKSLSDGAITFADGTNSGIVISNVGSAEGDQITFDITFAEVSEDDYWQNVSAQEKEDPSQTIISYMDTDGTLYYLQRKNNAISGPVYLYTYTSGSWNRLSSALPGSGIWYHLEKYNGSIYSGYVENDRVKLARWNGTKWETVYTSSVSSGELDMTSDANGICLAYTSNDGRKLYAYRYSGTSVQALGNQVATANEVSGFVPNRISNPSVAAENGKIAVMYREAFNNNRVFVRLYEDTDNTWKTVGTLPLSANSGMIRLHRNQLYMLKNGEEFGKDEAYLYAYDLSEESGEWSRLGDGFYANESIAEMALVFQGDTPYIAYLGGTSQTTYVMTLDKGKWTPLGGRVAGELISGLSAYLYDGKIYVTYLSGVNNRVYIKVHKGGHRYEAAVVREATCSAEGEVIYTCSDCQDTYTEATAKLPHPYGSWSTVVSSTCLKEGKKTRKCTVCAETENAAIAKLTTHKYGSWSTATASTCLREGKKTRKCTVCGKTESAAIAKLTTHKYGSWSTTTASTCLKEGKKTRKCTVCGKTESAVIAKRGHTPGAAATCTKAQTCKVCKAVLKKALGHRRTRTEKLAATFLRTGYTKIICKDCGAVISKKTLAKISCKKGQVYTVGNYKYKIISAKTNGTGTVSFVGLAKSVSSVTIGDTVTILGAKFKIVQISDKALKNKTGVTSVTIGSNVQTIGKEAFYGMKKLKTLTIKSTKITKVGSNALKGIYSSAKIKVPKSKLSKYKSLFKNKGQKSSVKIY